MERPQNYVSENKHARNWKPQNRQLWFGITITILAICGALIWTIRKHQNIPPVDLNASQIRKSIPVSVELTKLSSTPIILEVTGTIRPELESPIAAKVLARVQSVLIKEGESVRKSQSLIILDAQDMDASISQASANLRAANIRYDSAGIAVRMESSLSEARISEAKSKVIQSEAALQSAKAELELAQAGPRRQEREQAVLAVSQAKSGLTLSENNLKRMDSLYKDGAISAQQYDQYKSQYEIARTQYETVQQGKSIADEGSRIEDIRAAQQSVRQAEAAVQEANAGLKSSQASAIQIDVRKQEIQGAHAQIAQSRASLQLANVNRDYTIIKSPFDGIVTKRQVDPGAMASPGSVLLTIQGGALRLEAVVPESSLFYMKVGATVPVYFNALQNRSLTGRIVEIAPEGDSTSHTFIVKINLPATSKASAGMFGRAKFSTGMENRILVPSSATWTREGLHYLYVVDENQLARMRMVTVGDPAGEKIPVLSGLNSGESVVISNRDRIIDGSPVSVEPR